LQTLTADAGFGPAESRRWKGRGRGVPGFRGPAGPASAPPLGGPRKPGTPTPLHPP